MNDLATALLAAGETLPVGNDRASCRLEPLATPRTHTSAELRKARADAVEANATRKQRTERLDAKFRAENPPPRFLAEPAPEQNDMGRRDFQSPWPFDAKDAADVFSSWLTEWQRAAIYAVLHRWPAWRLRALARVAIDLADRKAAALRR